MKISKGHIKLEKSIIFETGVSMSAIGLFTIIKSLADIPNYELKKDVIQRYSKLGEKPFDKLWKELKKFELITVTRSRNGSSWNYKIELSESFKRTVVPEEVYPEKKITPDETKVVIPEDIVTPDETKVVEPEIEMPQDEEVVVIPEEIVTPDETTCNNDTLPEDVATPKQSNTSLSDMILSKTNLDLKEWQVYISDKVFEKKELLTAINIFNKKDGKYFTLLIKIYCSVLYKAGKLTESILAELKTDWTPQEEVFITPPAGQAQVGKKLRFSNYEQRVYNNEKLEEDLCGFDFDDELPEEDDSESKEWLQKMGLIKNEDTDGYEVFDQEAFDKSWDA